MWVPVTIGAVALGLWLLLKEDEVEQRDKPPEGRPPFVDPLSKEDRESRR
jgi:hypothetical protein